MIYIFTSLYCEAKPIIQYFGLKRQDDINGFQYFANDSVSLLITGTGSINAAVGVASLCSVHTPDTGDILINLGICGTENLNLKKGTLILCNKIIDLSTHKSYYPDMLFRHPFMEGTVETSPVPVTGISGKHDESSDIVVTDMEASGVFHAGEIFFRPHQLFFFKIVSDYQTGEIISKERATELIAGNVEPVAVWITRIHDSLPGKQSVFSDEEKVLLKQATDAMKLTVSMQHQLNHLMQYYKIQHGSFYGKLTEFLKENLIEPCKSKNEGKKYFDKLKREFV